MGYLEGTRPLSLIGDEDTEVQAWWESQDGPIGPGLAVGEFVIDREIARGGMGTVYAAHHPLIGKKAAIKVISQSFLDDDDATARFLREARAVNEISHPNIVDIFSFGTVKGRPYYVMEWLDGEALGAEVERGPVGLRRAVQILESICDALSAAHDKDIIHRDLKPDNVFLVNVRGGRQHVKLLDFGIAKLTSSRSHQTTVTGLVLGTPAYISPEQARGRGVDARTDIYSLGAMMFEMLTGQLPFVGESAADTVSLHLHQPAPRVSSQWKRVPVVLDDLVDRMMAKSPDDRPDLGEVRDVLVRLQKAGPARAGSLDDVAFEETVPKLETIAVSMTTEKVAAPPARGAALVGPLLLSVVLALVLVLSARTGPEGSEGEGPPAAAATRPAVSPLVARDRIDEPAKAHAAPATPAPAAAGDAVVGDDGDSDAVARSATRRAAVERKRTRAERKRARAERKRTRAERRRTRAERRRADESADDVRSDETTTPQGKSDATSEAADPVAGTASPKTAGSASKDATESSKPTKKPDSHGDIDYMLDPFERN